MPVVVSHQIRKKEFGARIPPGDIQAILRAGRAALATPLAAKGLPPRTRLLKGYATSANGPRRIVYLLAVEDGTLFLLFYRDKNDPVGKNIAAKNPAFVEQLKKHLALLHADIEGGKFDMLQ